MEEKLIRTNIKISKNNLLSKHGAKISIEYYNEFNAGGDLIFEDLYEFEVKYLIQEEMG